MSHCSHYRADTTYDSVWYRRAERDTLGSVQDELGSESKNRNSARRNIPQALQETKHLPEILGINPVEDDIVCHLVVCRLDNTTKVPS